MPSPDSRREELTYFVSTQCKYTGATMVPIPGVLGGAMSGTLVCDTEVSRQLHEARRLGSINYKEILCGAFYNQTSTPHKEIMGVLPSLSQTEILTTQSSAE